MILISTFKPRRSWNNENTVPVIGERSRVNIKKRIGSFVFLPCIQNALLGQFVLGHVCIFHGIKIISEHGFFSDVREESCFGVKSMFDALMFCPFESFREHFNFVSRMNYLGVNVSIRLNVSKWIWMPSPFSYPTRLSKMFLETSLNKEEINKDDETFHLPNRLRCRLPFQGKVSLLKRRCFFLCNCDIFIINKCFFVLAQFSLFVSLDNWVSWVYF